MIKKKKIAISNPSGTLSNSKLLNKSNRRSCSNPWVSWWRQDIRYVPYTPQPGRIGLLAVSLRKHQERLEFKPQVLGLGIHRTWSPLYSNWKRGIVSLRKGMNLIRNYWYWRAAPLGVLAASPGLGVQRIEITQQAQLGNLSCPEILERDNELDRRQSFEVSPEEEVKCADDVQMYNKLPQNEKEYVLFTVQSRCRKSSEVENCCMEFYMTSPRNCCRRWIEPICLREGHPAGFRYCWLRKADSVLSLLTHGCWQMPCGVDYSNGSRTSGLLLWAGHPWRHKTSWQGWKPTWLNREFWMELGQKRSIHALWKKEQAKETCKDVVRLCREKIRRTNLGTTIKDDKNVYAITSAVEGGIRKISSFTGCRG